MRWQAFADTSRKYPALPNVACLMVSRQVMYVLMYGQGGTDTSHGELVSKLPDRCWPERIIGSRWGQAEIAIVCDRWRVNLN